MQVTSLGLSSMPAVTAPGLDQAMPAHATPKDAAKAFEGMFASILIKHMRQTLNGQGLFAHDPGDVMGGLFDHFMSQHVAQNGGLGIAALMQKRLGQGSHGT